MKSPARSAPAKRGEAGQDPTEKEKVVKDGKEEEEAKGPEEQEEEMSENMWTLTQILAVAVGVCAYLLFSKLHDLDTGYSLLNPLQRRLQLYSEQAFYYSFYEDLVVQNTTLQEGFWGLFNESRSEYPSHINAIERFNIYPEVLSAAGYHFLGRLAPADPLDWMVMVLMGLAGLQWAGFFVCASYLGRSPLCGLVAVAFAILYVDNCSRINMHLTLRENFALPFLWWQVFIVLLNIRQPRPSAKYLFYFVVFTCAFMLCWQFAQFILLLQLAALFAAYASGSLSRDLFVGLIKAYLISYAVVITVTLGNTMLLTSMHLLLCVALWLVLAVDTPRSNFTGRLTQGAVAGAVFIAGKIIAGILVPDDAHIFRILRAKLFGYEDFITFLYLCGPTYRATDIRDLDGLYDSGLMQCTLGIVVVLVILVLAELVRGGRVDPSYCFMAGQGLLFTILALTVRRLAVVSIPHMALLAGLIASTTLFEKVWHAVTRRRVELLGISLVVVSLMCVGLSRHTRVHGLAEDLAMAQPNARPDDATGFLMNFLSHRTSPDAIVVGDSVITSMVKLLTRRRIPFHPHVENQDIRQRHFDFFQIYNRVPEEEVHAMLLKWDADYVIISDGPCHVRCPEGQTMADMANAPDAFGRRGRGRPNLPPFCETVRHAPLKLFSKVYDQGPFVVLRVKKGKARKELT